MKNTLTKILYIILIIAVILFIFSNSLSSMDESANESGRVMQFFNNFFEALHLPFRLNEFFVRKAAHFTEFFILGTLLFGYTAFFSAPNLNSSVYCSFISCLTAMTDETIQYFTHRGSMLLDVWLDASSAAFAIFLFFGLYKLKHKKRKRSVKKKG